jgi:hypothetical protein
MVNLRPLVLIIGKAFIHLGPGYARKTLGNGVNGLSILQQTDDVMHTHTGVFNPRMSAPDIGRSCNVSVSFVDDCHELSLTALPKRRKFGFELQIATDEFIIRNSVFK